MLHFIVEGNESHEMERDFNWEFNTLNLQKYRSVDKNFSK